MVHADSFRINIFIADMHRLTARILDASNVFRNTNVPIHERVCIIPPPYYLYWFESSYPNVPINLDYGPFVLDVQIEFREQNQLDDNGIYLLMQWSQLLNIRKVILIMISISNSYLM